MPLHNHGYFLNQKKVFLMISYLIIIFFFAYFSIFALKNEYRSADLEQIQYCYTARDKTVSEEMHSKPVNSLREIEHSSEKYLYIKGSLPEVPYHNLVLYSLNGTAKINVNGQELYNNIFEKTLAGSSYITVPLGGNMSGGTVEILLYSPLSDYFEIEIIPAEKTVFAFSNVPFAFFYVAGTLFLGLVASAVLTLLSKGKKPRAATVLMFVSALVALAVFVLEYWPLHSNLHFLFNIKIFLWLLIPIFALIELSLRCGEWDTKMEAVLSVNILYALCIVFLWENVFFFILLSSGVFLQAANFLLVARILSKQSKPFSEHCFAAAVVFWGLNLLLWIFVSFKRVTWQPLAFIMAVFFYCFCQAVAAFRQRRPEKQHEFILPTENANSSVLHFAKQNTDFNHGPEFLPAGFEIPENCSKALTAFHTMVLNKVYVRETHSLKVSEYSKIISSYMGMSRNASNEIAKAAALHDIGKLCVPEKILFKKERLTEEEFEEIKRHVIYGYKLLNSEDKFLKMAALVAKEHHEHIDGTGYMGLKENEISLPAKVVAVADVFDALVSKRSYKESWSFEETFAYICEHDTDYFDKGVVEAFKSAKDKIYELYAAGILSALNGNLEERN